MHALELFPEQVTNSGGLGRVEWREKVLKKTLEEKAEWAELDAKYGDGYNE
jgi:hypothetical protein